MDVTRDDISQYVGTAFIGGGAARVDLLALARARRASADVMQVLTTLPDRRYRRLLEVWDELPDLPPVAARLAS
jgi:hypothetical protein